MKELRITDQDLQALVAPALRERLKKVGFVLGRSTGEFPAAVWVPINLDLVGWCHFVRTDDGVWVFQQDENRMAEIVADGREDHGEAIATRQAPRA
jgi:hypothetical protein